MPRAPMRPTAKLVCYAAALLLGAGLAGRAEALCCGSRVVDRGTLDVQVLRRCGEPCWWREQVEWIIAGDGTPIERRTERVTENWFYNFEPRRLLVRLRFIDGVRDEWWFNSDDSALLARVILGQNGIESVQDVRL